MRACLFASQAKELLAEARALPPPTADGISEGGDGDDDAGGLGGFGGKRGGGDSAAEASAARLAAKKRAKEVAALGAWLFELRAWLLALPDAVCTAKAARKDFPGLPLSPYCAGSSGSGGGGDGEAGGKADGKACKAAKKGKAGSGGGEPPLALAFAAPAKVDVVGDFMLKTLLDHSSSAGGAASGGCCAVDVVLTLPPACLGPRDHVNCRYLDRRHLYLAHVAARLAEDQHTLAAVAAAPGGGGTGGSAPRVRTVRGVSFGLAPGHEHDPASSGRKCSVLLRPFGLGGRRFTVRLSCTLRPADLRPQRLLPDKSNLRRFWTVTGAAAAATAAAAASSSAAVVPANALGVPPTPHYNSLVLEDVGWLIRRTSLLHAAMQPGTEDGCPALRDAMLLTRCWLAARTGGGGGGRGGSGGRGGDEDGDDDDAGALGPDSPTAEQLDGVLL